MPNMMKFCFGETGGGTGQASTQSTHEQAGVSACME